MTAPDLSKEELRELAMPIYAETLGEVEALTLPGPARARLRYLEQRLGRLVKMALRVPSTDRFDESSLRLELGGIEYQLAKFSPFGTVALTQDDLVLYLDRLPADELLGLFRQVSPALDAERRAQDERAEQAAAAAQKKSGTVDRDAMQKEAHTWVRRTFGEDVAHRQERASRLLEEVLELAQAEKLSVDHAKLLAEHVYAKPAGDPAQELGGIGLTLLAYAEAAGLSAQEEESRELSRVLAIPAETFRRRHQVKVDAGVAMALGDAEDEDYRAGEVLHWGPRRSAEERLTKELSQKAISMMTEAARAGKSLTEQIHLGTLFVYREGQKSVAPAPMAPSAPPFTLVQPISSGRSGGGGHEHANSVRFTEPSAAGGAQGEPAGSKPDPGHPNLVNGEFQSDKYPTTPRGKVPLSVKDKSAQDLLWQYAGRRRAVDAAFSRDLEAALLDAGYKP